MQKNPASQDAIVFQTESFILTIYEGSIGATFEVMATINYLLEQLSRE